MLLEADKASLLLVDVQERLLPAMARPDAVLEKCVILQKAARELSVPITLSEQYPKGLGPTVPALRGDDCTLFEKLSFSCWRDPDLRQHFINLHEQGRQLIVVAGIESHVCVLQTAMDLSAAGFGVFAVADAMSSRREESLALALKRMADNYIQIVNTEMVVFEMLRKAGTPAFKTLSALIR